MAQKKVYQPFEFKNFIVHQNKSAMKVGTDGVLIGAWAAIPKDCGTILDIGTGTGLIALMLAQRSTAKKIIGLEPDVLAFEEALYNFNISKWSQRLECRNLDLASFDNIYTGKFDLIISNPPFHQESIHSNNLQRHKARSISALPFEDILFVADKKLNPGGSLSLIVPYSIEPQILKKTTEMGLHISRITRVSGTKTSPLKRSLLEIKKEYSENCSFDFLYLEDERHKYSAVYRKMTEAFYK